MEWNGAVHTRLHSTIVCLVRPTCTCRSDITTGWLLPNCNSEHAIRTRIRHDENNRAWVQQKQVGSVRCCARYQQAGGRKGNATNDTLCRLISFTRHLKWGGLGRGEDGVGTVKREQGSGWGRGVHTIRYDTIRYDTIRYDTIRYDTIRYDTIRYDTIPYHTIPYHTIPYHTIPYHTIPYHTIPYHIPKVTSGRWAAAAVEVHRTSCWRSAKMRCLQTWFARH